MSLLFDQNLSQRLVALRAAEYHGSEHVESAGLMGVDDLTVWHYAAAHSLRAVSKDSDFRQTNSRAGIFNRRWLSAR